jgi:hypothetical protein
MPNSIPAGCKVVTTTHRSSMQLGRWIPEGQ